MGAEKRTTYNRRVHAEVSITDPVQDVAYIEKSFRDRDWAYERLSQGQYLLSVPVYSAYIAGRDVVRAKLLDFGDQVATLEVVSMRSQRGREPKRYRYTSIRFKASSGRWRRWGRRRFRIVSTQRAVDAERSFRFGSGEIEPPKWELTSEFPLRDHYLDYLEERFTPSLYRWGDWAAEDGLASEGKEGYCRWSLAPHPQFRCGIFCGSDMCGDRGGNFCFRRTHSLARTSWPCCPECRSCGRGARRQECVRMACKDR